MNLLKNVKLSKGVKYVNMIKNLKKKYGMDVEAYIW